MHKSQSSNQLRMPTRGSPSFMTAVIALTKPNQEQNPESQSIAIQVEQDEQHKYSVVLDSFP